MFNDRLAEIDAGLTILNTHWTEWNDQLAETQQELVDSGMDWWEAIQTVHQRHVESIRSGDCPVDFDQLHDLLDELCGIYLEADPGQRVAIRAVFDDKGSVLKYLYSYIGGRVTRLLKSSEDVKWLRLGLAAAAIEDMRVDYRDLLICLGKLYLAAESIGIKPLSHFKAVARMSSAQGRYGGGSTRDLLAEFHTSGHLRSIKRKRNES